jgi:hypothetical protein
MVGYASGLGLKLSPKPKEGRDRLAGRLSALIEKLPEQKKSEAINNLLDGRSSQTQGWIDVITSEKR